MKFIDDIRPTRIEPNPPEKRVLKAQIDPQVADALTKAINPTYEKSSEDDPSEFFRKLQDDTFTIEAENKEEYTVALKALEEYRESRKKEVLIFTATGEVRRANVGEWIKVKTVHSEPKEFRMEQVMNTALWVYSYPIYTLEIKKV